MKKILTLFALSALLLVTHAFAWAQTISAQPPSQSTPAPNIPTTLTLDDAIKAAIARNYTVKTSANNARSAAIEVTRSKDNMWLPTVGASGSWGYNYSLTPVADRTRETIASQPGFVRTTSGDTLLVSGVPTGAGPVEIVTPAGSH